MRGDERTRSLAVGGFASLAIHLAVAVALWSGPVTSRIAVAGGTEPGAVVVDPVTDSGVATARAGYATVIERLGQLATANHSEAAKWLNHLWQSTLFALAVGLMTLAFRRNQARVRYCLWFSASVKFVLPFSWLVLLGSRLPWASATPPAETPGFSLAIAQFGQPFVESTPALPTASPSVAADWFGIAILALWICGSLAILLLRAWMWQRILRAVQASAPTEIPDIVLPRHVQVRIAPGLLEPAVVGFWRPIILLPAGIQDHLTHAQLEAVLAHEICHIRRGDNLTAALHMMVEAVFWFHPLVWWIGARLVDERERACDEAVLRFVRDPRTYADGIVNVCRRYVDARLAHVPGVSGSDLKKRIEAIMSNRQGEVLGPWRTLVLATVAAAAIAAPIVIGALNAPRLRAQSQSSAAALPAFEVASIKQNRSQDVRITLVPQPGGRLTATNVTAAMLIRFAYDLSVFQVAGGPDWLGSDRFDVLAKAEGDPPVEQKRLMLRRLLADRFSLSAHTETRELPIYALVLARSDGKPGPQLRRSPVDCARVEQPSSDAGVGPSPSAGPPSCGYFGFSPGTEIRSGRGGLGFRGLTMAAVAKSLGPMVGRSVSDQTGLAGYFDGEFDFPAELPPPPPPPGVPNPFQTPFVSVFTVLPEQLGLKFESRRGPVEVLVIDRAERPTPD